MIKSDRRDEKKYGKFIRGQAGRLILAGMMILLYLAPDVSAQELSQTLDQRKREVLEDTCEGIDGLLLKKDRHRVIELSLQNCIQRALANNLDIRIEGYQPAVSFTNVIEAEAVFDATMFASGRFDFNDQANIDTGFFTRTIVTDGGEKNIRIPSEPFVVTHDYNYNLGLRKRLSTGATMQVSQQLRRFRDLNNDGELFYDPFFEYRMRFEISQPLLRDFGLKFNRANIQIRRNDYKISEQRFHSLVISTLREVEQNYWTLLFARKRVQIFSGLVERANHSLERIQQRTPYDTRSEVVLRTRAVIKRAEADLVSARNDVFRQQYILLESLNDPCLPLEEDWEIITTDLPSTWHYQIDNDKALETAMLKRPEIIQQKLELDKSRLSELIAKNRRLPRLDLTVIQQFSGVGDESYAAWDDQWRNNMLSSSYLVEFEVPLGNRAAEAALARTRYQKIQNRLNVHNIQEQVLVDVQNALQELENKYEEILVRLEALQAAQQEVDNFLAIQDIERQDSTTPNFINLKLNADERLANTQRSAILAIIQYNIALMDVHRAQGILLRYNNIKLAELLPDID